MDLLQSEVHHSAPAVQW